MVAAGLTTREGRRPMADERLVRIYLQDHAAAMTATGALLRRAAHDVTRAEVRSILRDIADRFDSDRGALAEVMRAIEVAPSTVKNAAAWVGERAGRLKTNGRLTSRSPLSDIVELEALTLALTSTALGWTTLIELSTHDRRLDEEMLRATLRRTLDERRRVEVLRLHCVRESLS